MKECQYKIYNDIKNVLNQDLHDVKTRTLITLSYYILTGYNYQIDFLVKKAISYGASREDFMKIISCITGDMRLYNSVMKLFRIVDENLKNEENK
jgi:alkylhydroperoxidase/carboxymuconolactone decarboxylase family protein YurZ